jgi:predicted HTH transcriptional regulator
MEPPEKLNFSKIADLIGIDEFHEDATLEIKLGLGEKNIGELPKSFFPSYSAMGNTQGGTVVLGFREISDDVYEFVGIKNTDAILKQLWSSLGNKNKVNTNLLSNKNAEVVELSGKKLIKITIPAATRKQKPIFINNNPFLGTYRRDFDGDHLCDEETVKRMLVEQVEDSLDFRILNDFNEADIDTNTVKAYRNAFSTVKPDHLWNSKDDQEFLRSVGAINVDRATEKVGLTVAGLLMFGKYNSIVDEFPNYYLDYQEHDNENSEKRWIDRIVPDGTWSGNLFDFYQKVIQKLYENIKVPFIISGTTRIDESPVHIALREALTNTLVHSDYGGRVPIKIIKRPDMFCFQNPGTMRIPIPDAIHGGNSDCRNKRLQNMFTFIGRGDRAGTGIPKIYKNWTDQLWQLPILKEKFAPDHTILQLNMVDLLPEETIKKLRLKFGPKFDLLNQIKKVALVFASLTGSIDHARLKEVSMLHPHDLTKELKELVEGGYLEPMGASRGTVYFLPATTVQKTISAYSKLTITEEPIGSSVHPVTSSVHLNGGSVHLELKEIAKNVHSRGGVLREEMDKTILKLCEKQFLTVQEIAQFVNRSPSTIRTHYINRLVRTGYLRIRYPTRSHPNQAYFAVKQIVNKEKK